MEYKRPDHDQQEGATRGGRSLQRFLPSKWSQPNLRNSGSKKAANAQMISGVSISATSSETKLDDDDEDAQLDSKTVAVGSNGENDMWTTAEAELRKDPEKCKILEKYDRILEDHFKSKLEPVGTPERRKQFRDFLSSEIKELDKIDSESRLRGCSNKAKRFFRTAVDCIIASKDIITAAAAPCLPASVACAGVSVLLSLCVQAADQRHVLFDSLNAISGLVHRLAKYEKLLSKDEIQRDEEVICLMTPACCNIIEFQARAACFLQCNPIESKLRNAFKLDGWDKLLEAIKVAEGQIKDCAERNSMNSVSNIFIKVSKLEDGVSKLAMMKQENYQRKRTQRFLQLLYKNTCNCEESKCRNDKRVVGTCDWFTDHNLFKAWNFPMGNRSKTSNLLYVTADPGCGKSVLSRYLIDDILPDDGRTVCYFFFKDDFEDQRSSLSALCNLLHQFFDLSPELLTDDILTKYEARGEKFVESFSEVWKMFVDVAGRRETVCVLDALEECRESDRKQLIDAITGTQVSSLKFLLTSRPYDHIRGEFSQRLKDEFTAIHLQGDCGDTAEEIAQEIQLVVDNRIDQLRYRFTLTPSECQSIGERFKSVPNRTYLWVTLVFHGLMEQDPSTPSKDIMNMVKQLPQGLYDAYENILKHSLDRKEAKKLLHLVLGAKRPLSLSEVSIALAYNGQQTWDALKDNIISEDKLEPYVKGRCGLFVIVVDKKLYLIHQTAREFLVRDFSNQNSVINGDISGKWFHDAAAFVFIAQSFVLLLNLAFRVMRPFFHRIWLCLTSSWQHSMDLTCSNSVLAEICISQLQWDLAEENNPMFEYSAIFWVDHYRESEWRCQKALAETTRDLCRPSELRTEWTQIHKDHGDIPTTGSSLCLASALGLDRAVKLFLLEQDSIDLDLWKDSKVNSKDERGRTPLLWTVLNGHKAIVELLLKTGKVEIDSKDKYGQTPFLLAARNGYQTVIELLLKTGMVEIDLKDKYGRTPFSWAARNGHKTIVELLLKTGKVEIDSKDEYGRTPFSSAAENGHMAIVELLLKTGKVEIDSKDEYGRTPFWWAAENGHRAILELLLKTGKVEIDSKDEYGRTPFWWAAENGHQTVVELLLKTGTMVEIDSEDEFGQTPFSMAAKNGHQTVVELLLKTGMVEIDSKDKIYGQTPFSWAAQNGHKAIVELLLKTGKVEIDSKDKKYGQTPLSSAAENGHKTIVELLLQTGKVEIDSKDKIYGQTPLSSAAENGHKTIVELLLQTGKVEIDSKDKIYGQTPLSWAAQNGHKAIVELLLKTGKVEIDSKDKIYGQTPLSWAAQNGHKAIVELLLKTDKVEIDSKDKKYGQTPLQWAAENGHQAVVQLLESKRTK